MDPIRLTFVTPEGGRWERQVRSVNLVSEDGSLGILAGHAPMLCTVRPCVVRARFGEEGELRVRVGEGFAWVENNGVTLLVAEAEEVN
ncbi:MAG: F0F1 ATP synthase subunit epsilon [Oscillospiraceae bacterium]|nr:F0F1 ATP synthase subunit epsilon [Oscillospiraceae bacterium]